MNNPRCIRTLTILWAVAFFSIIGMEATFAQDQFFEQNTNRPGQDYTSFDIESKGPESLWGPDTDCQLSCGKDSKCRAWTYVKPGIQGPKARCWLKNVIPAAHANNCCTSGVVTREFEPNTDRPGNDYTNFDLQAPDSNVCRAACGNDQKCLAWTYVRPGIQGPKARCWLKNVIPAAHANDCCMSGVAQRGPVVK